MMTDTGKESVMEKKNMEEICMPLGTWCDRVRVLTPFKGHGA